MWPSSSTAWCDPLTQPLRHGSEKMSVTPRKERWRYIFEAAPYICTFFYRAPKWEKTGKISLSSLHWVRLSLFNGPDIQPPPPTHLTFANWPRNSRGTKQSGPVRNLANMQVWPFFFFLPNWVPSKNFKQAKLLPHKKRWGGELPW